MTTEWLRGLKVNSRTSPTAAVTLLGENVKAPFGPTWIGIVTALAPEASATTAAIRDAERMVRNKDWERMSKTLQE